MQTLQYYNVSSDLQLFVSNGLIQYYNVSSDVQLFVSNGLRYDGNIYCIVLYQIISPQRLFSLEQSFSKEMQLYLVFN